MSGQSIVDRLNAAKYSIAGRGLAKSVCKATTEEVLGPKKKHVDYLVQCTKEPNVSIPVLANLLIERTQEQKWVVVFKSLITIHNLMNYGNERFTQYLASNTGFHLDGFSDKTTVQAADMSKFIQRYAKYIQEKSASYRINAFDFCKIKRGKDDGVLRTMNGEKLLKTLPTLQSQLDALIAFDATPNELTNNVIHTCFILLFKDLIRLFACYNDGIINLLEKYFEMNKKQCKEGLDIYKKFLVRMDQVSEFLKVAENMGVDRGDIPDLAKAPSSLLDALESHLASLEGKKGGSTPTGSGSEVTARPAGFTNTVNNFSKASSGGVGASSVSPTLGGITDDERRKALEQEEQTMQQLKMAASPTQPMPQQHVNQQRSPTMPQTTQSTNPFASATTTTTSANDTVDLFGSSATFQAQSTSMPSDDLLGLGTGSSNPFATSMTATSPGQPANNFMAQSATTNPWAGTESAANNNMNFGMSAPATNNEINFEAAFGNQSQPGLGVRANGYPASSSVLPPPGYDGFGDVMQPAAQRAQQQQGSRLIKQDLDSSLASIVGNLNINGPGQHLKKTEHQWSPSANKGQKTGGANWQAPMPAASFQSWSQQGMGQQTGPRPAMGMQPQQPGMFPQGTQQQQQPMMGAHQPNLFQQPAKPQQSQPLDPFGSL